MPTLNDITQGFREATARAPKGFASIVAVFYGPCVLMGRRRDSGKFTFPGGGANLGERPLNTALRELEEETGIRTTSLQLLGHRTNHVDVRVTMFMLETYDQPTDVSQDPDAEVYRWEWVPVFPCLPVRVLANLHHSPNFMIEELASRKLIGVL